VAGSAPARHDANPDKPGRSRGADRARAQAEVPGRPELAPGGSASAVLAAAGWPDAREPVLIVGHQPTLGEVAAFLLTSDESPWSVRKAAVFWLSNRVRDGASSTVLKVVIGPDFV